MKKLKKVLSLILALIMILSSPIGALSTNAAENDDFYKIVHVDAGRKYFSPSSLKTIIDNAAEAGFNQVELYLSDNQGFRFALDTMTITTTYGTYDLTPSLGDGYSQDNGAKNPDGSGKYLTQSEMTEIIAYAKDKGIDIVPCINVPGHMGAILENFTSFRYTKNGSTSQSSIDLENEEAVAFALAITKAYAEYFAGQGVKYYNVGADEYANDLLSMGFEGMGSDLYTKFVEFLNDAADIVIAAGMTPRAFNDGFYYKDYSISVEPNKAYEVCYWSSGWSGYDVAAASTIAAKGHKMINTHGDYYWILGGSQCTAEKASQFDYTAFQGSTISDPAGAMFCIWCDDASEDGADDGVAVVSETADVIAAFGATLPASETSDSEDDTNTGDSTDGDAEVEVTNNKTITVTVGQTATDTIDGADYTGNIVDTELDKTIATVSAEYEKVEGGTVVSTVTSITSGSSYYIRNSDGKYLASNGSWADSIDSAVKWTVTEVDAGYRISLNGTYLRYNEGLTTTIKSSRATNWSFNNGTLSNASYTLGTTVSVSTTESVDATTVTFKGVAAGTTYVTVGNTRYTINVVKEDLSAVNPLTVEYWITNVRVTADDSQSIDIKATDSGVYSESGVKIADFIPNNGSGNAGAAVVFWKVTRLSSDNEQTTSAGDDETLSGTDFSYVRYWDGSWAYSVDGTIWKNVVSGDQIVAYYLQYTAVTDEIETLVVDWGVVPSISYNSTDFVLVDYAVKYESGERVPDSFPVSGKTQAFHCDPNDTTTVHQYNNGSSSTWSNNYREIGMIKANETSEYEVYMITLTPTSDSQTTQVAGNANAATSYTYGGTEKVLWVDDEANLGAFADESLHFESISGNISYSVGGEPIVEGLEIFNRHGMLVTYYVRAKATEDSLAVHYIDATEGANNLEFYNYNIAVKEGTSFDKNIALNTANPNSDLLNGTVTNYYNKTQTVSADLSTLSQIGAQYLYSEYTCTKVVRSENGKDVYLYYTFNPTVYFMADFGLAIDIKASDLNSKLTDAIVTDMKFTGVSSTSYGKLTDNGTTVTYTPSKTLAGLDYFTLIVETSSAVDDILDEESTQIAFRVYVMPATTVYYEEEFATLNGFTLNGTADAGKQTTEIAGSHVNNYGYDKAYSKVEASNGTQATSTTYGDKAEFTFTGNGVDIYTNNTTETGSIFIQVKNSSGSTVKMIQVKTAMINGSTGATTGQAVTGYNVPVASIDLGTKDTYTVYITHVKPSSDATEDTVNLDGFRVYGTLDLNTAVYVKDKEDNPEYYQLRDMVLNVLGVSGATSQQIYDATAGATAIITDESVTYGNSSTVQDLLDNGPKNEVYLYNSQTLTFKVTTSRLMQIGMKALNGNTTYTLALNGKTVETDQVTGDLATSVDMFYELGNTAGTEMTYTVTITNTGSNILSITDLKICDDPNAAFEALTVEDIEYALTPAETAPEVTYADATLNLVINNMSGDALASTALTANGIIGEANTFTAASIEEAVASILPEGYELTDATYADQEVAYGEEASVTFTAEEIVEEEPETPVVTVINKIISTIKNFFNKIFSWF